MPTGPARSHRRAGWLALLIALCLVGPLTSCAPDPSPGTPPPTAGPTATPTPSLPAPAPSPTPPAEMSRDDEAGAVAAVNHFLALYAYTESSQDTTAWQSMSHPDCVFCKSVIDDVAARQAAHEVTHPAAMQVMSRTVEPLNALAYTVVVDVSTGPDTLWSLDGTLVDPGTIQQGRMTMVMVNQRNTWLVREVQLDLAK